MDRLRVASIQYWIRPVRAFEEFRDQVDGLIETAVDYKARLVVFPEYFTLQLLTLANIRRPIHEQIRDLAGQVPRFTELMAALARKHALYIVAGTIPVLGNSAGVVHNHSLVFGPNGEYGIQGKLHMTRFESEEWLMSPADTLRVFDTDFGRMAVAVCYDVEFPEIVRAAAREEAHILVVPTCTDERQGYFRVRYCAHARAIENQMYVIQACTVGSLPMVPAVSLNYGQAAIITPSDFPFSRDGILAEGNANQEMMVIGELNLRTIADARSGGTVLPLLDSRRSAEIASRPEVVRI